MKANTRFFGEIDIADDKIIAMETGMIGFPDLKHFALIFDEDKGMERSNIMWLQSMENGNLAFPVMMPNKIKPDYAPNVNESILAPLGELQAEDIFILTTVTVPKKVEDLSINLKAPIVINAANNKGVQIIVEDDYPVKFKIYDLVKGAKEKAGE